MTDDRTVDRLLAHRRGQVTELRRRQREGAAPEELEERRRVIGRLQRHLADSVADVLSVPRRPQLG